MHDTHCIHLLEIPFLERQTRKLFKKDETWQKNKNKNQGFFKAITKIEQF